MRAQLDAARYRCALVSSAVKPVPFPGGEHMGAKDWLSILFERSNATSTLWNIEIAVIRRLGRVANGRRVRITSSTGEQRSDTLWSGIRAGDRPITLAHPAGTLGPGNRPEVRK
jgi:hypothetical protein